MGSGNSGLVHSAENKTYNFCKLLDLLGIAVNVQVKLPSYYYYSILIVNIYEPLGWRSFSGGGLA